jgi:hypothetical protein
MHYRNLVGAAAAVFISVCATTTVDAEHTNNATSNLRS